MGTKKNLINKIKKYKDFPKFSWFGRIFY